jgi:hypothetical protein
MTKPKKLRRPLTPKLRRSAGRPSKDVLSVKPLRTSAPSAHQPDKAMPLGSDAVLSENARADRDRDLESLARNRRDAEARAGSVKLS